MEIIPKKRFILKLWTTKYTNNKKGINFSTD